MSNRGLAVLAVTSGVMAAAAAWLALALSPWLLLIWPACAVLFAVLAVRAPRPRVAAAHVVPPCTGCASALCPDCRSLR